MSKDTKNIQIISKDGLSIYHPETSINNVKGLGDELDNKVDKVDGKGLSTNDYNDTEKEQVWINQGSISDSEIVDKKSTTHRRQVNVSYNSVANGNNSQVNAGSSSIASGSGSQVNASYSSEASGDRSQVNASDSSEASGVRSQVNASDVSTASGVNSQVNASSGSTVDGDGANSQINASKHSLIDYVSRWAHYGGPVIISGKAVKIDDSCGRGVIAGGGGTTSDEPSTQNRKWQIDGKGEIKASSSITGNSSFADFAEYMESSSGKSLPLGSLVTIDKGQFIRIAQEGDFPIGIISATAGIILNAQGFEHKERYLYDRYGQPIYVTKYAPILSNGDSLDAYSKDDPNLLQIGDVAYTEKDEEGNVIEVKVVELQEIQAQQLNPNWREDEEYIPREDRDEWNVVGMKGQIYVNIDDTVEEGGYIKCGKDGIATRGVIEVDYDGIKAHKLWRVMEITTPYSEEIGMGIARVII